MMRCQGVKKWLPLLVGGDLSPRKNRRIRSHVDSCPSCSRELEEFRAALDRIRREAAGEPRKDWSPGEWEGLMERIAADSPRPHKFSPLLRPQKALAFGVTAAFVAIFLLVLGRTIFLTEGTSPPFGPDIASRETPGAARDSSPALGSPLRQDSVSVTLVSEETGLQIVWVFNRDFEWKGDGQ